MHHGSGQTRIMDQDRHARTQDQDQIQIRQKIKICQIKICQIKIRQKAHASWIRTDTQGLKRHCGGGVVAIR